MECTNCGKPIRPAVADRRLCDNWRCYSHATLSPDMDYYTDASAALIRALRAAEVNTVFVTGWMDRALALRLEELLAEQGYEIRKKS